MATTQMKKSAVYLITGICIFATSLMATAIASIAIMTAVRASGQRDFVEYWAAGTQLIHGENPYNVPSDLRLERAAGADFASPLVIPNPPLILPVLAPLGLMNARAASLFWMMLHLIALGVSLWLIWRTNDKPPVMLLLLGLMFAPVLECIMAGQIGIFLLLSIALFLFLERAGHLGLAGAALIACGLKPHLFVIFGMILLAWIGYRRAYHVAIGLSIALLVTVSLAYWLDPHAWAQWKEFLRFMRLTEVFSPNLSKMLRLLVHRESVWIQFAPLVGGCGWAGWYFWAHRRIWDWLDHGMVLLVVSIGCSPYSWFTDEAVLLPAVLIAAFRIKTSRTSMIPFLLVMCFLLVELAKGLLMTTAYLVWSVPGYLMLVLYAKWAESRPNSVVPL
jgi:hypothetical protein